MSTRLTSPSVRSRNIQAYVRIRKLVQNGTTTRPSSRLRRRGGAVTAM